MKIYGNEYVDIIEELIKKLEGDFPKKERSQSDTDQKGEDVYKTQDE